MADTSLSAISEIEFWLQSALSSEKLTDFSVQLQGNSEKGDGYMGDILFTHVTGTKSGEKKQYDLVLKCAKRSQIIREKTPVQLAFLNEIYFFEKIVPTFSKFQKQNNVDEILSKSVAKYFGKFVSEDMEVIALQNLKKIGYYLWDRKQPLTRNHVNLLVKEYARFHATSAALQDQRKEEFEELRKVCSGSLFSGFTDTGSNKLFEHNIVEACNALEGRVDSKILAKLRQLEKEVVFIFKDLFATRKFSVIVHGDSWNNNFMFYTETGDIRKPTRSAILDWQLIEMNSPVRDLCYFLFATIGPEDINDLDRILLDYHQTFTEYLNKLGSNPEKLYPRSVFLEEWKKFAKFGIVMTATVAKVALRETDEVSDIAEVMESGAEFSDAFTTDIKNSAGYAERMKYIVDYAGKHDLL